MSDQYLPPQQDGPQRDPSDKHDDVSRTVVLVLGAILVLVGLFFLGRQWLWPGWVPINIAAVLDTLHGLGWGLGLIVIGVIVILLSQRKGFKPPAKGARLYRSRSNRMVSGVFGGLAEYFSMDATLVRLVYAGLALLFDLWPAVVAYIVAVIVVPEEPEVQAAPTPVPATPAPPPAQAPPPPAPPVPPAPPTSAPPAAAPVSEDAGPTDE